MLALVVCCGVALEAEADDEGQHAEPPVSLPENVPRADSPVVYGCLEFTILYVESLALEQFLCCAMPGPASFSFFSSLIPLHFHLS
ncbi:hypothetical protein Y032_0101g3351 [Ancylostoma ceylanicum]|uniref:Secreted protein n=1 Tax=Ancylostoma ceylanicum TaxID=53326 RepID=A0A016TGV1_9BILA|nr:hypothetical protein Y032_0101g3351 [Ancylostoma ceylanicum]